MTDLTAWALAAVLAGLFLAVGVLAVLGLRRRSGQDSAGESERAIEFGERPVDDDLFVDPALTAHRVLSESELACWRLTQSASQPALYWPASSRGELSW